MDTAILLCGILTCRQHFLRTGNQRTGAADFQPRGLELAFGRHPYTAAWLDAGERLSAVPLGQLQRNDDDVSAGNGIVFPSAAPARPGTHGSEPRSNMTASDISARSRRSSCTSIRRPGLTSARSATATRTTFRIRLWQPTSIAGFAWISRKQFPDYSDDLWGITASDSMHGYAVWGGPPATGPIDGTVVPCAAAGSLPFLPEARMRVLRTIKDRYGQNAWSATGSWTHSIH